MLVGCVWWCGRGWSGEGVGGVVSGFDSGGEVEQKIWRVFAVVDSV